MSTERVLVHKNVAKEFIIAFKKSVNEIYGPLGPPHVLASSLGVLRNRCLISEAVEKGATVILGNAMAKESSDTRLRPIVLGNVKKNMDLYYDESFGPIVSLFVFDSEDEAVELANDSEYGLVGAVFTENLATGLRIAHQYEAGWVTLISPC